MTIFTKTAVIKALKEIVDEVGEDYVYPRAKEYAGCVYTVNGEPSCLVGRVIAKLDPETFTKVVEAESSISGSWTAKHFANGSLIGHTDDEDARVYAPKLDATRAGMAALIEAQRAQDSADTYGNALGAAKESRA